MRSIQAVLIQFLVVIAACDSDGPGDEELRFEVDGQTVRSTSPDGSVRTNPQEWILTGDGQISISIRVMGRQPTGSLSFGSGVSATLTTPDGVFVAAPGGQLAFTAPESCKAEPSLFDPSATVTFCRYEGTFRFSAVDDAGGSRQVSEGRFAVTFRGIPN